MDKGYYKEYIKFREYYNVMQQWVVMLQNKISISEYLLQNGYKKIAVYGMSDIGNCLAAEITEDNKCDLLYAIDQGEPKLYTDISCIKLDEISRYDKPDLIIVTLPHIFEEIRDKIALLCDCKIKSITEIVYNACYNVRME